MASDDQEIESELKRRWLRWEAFAAYWREQFKGHEKDARRLLLRMDERRRKIEVTNGR